MDAAKKTMEVELKQVEDELSQLETLIKATPPIAEDIQLQVAAVDYQLEDFWKAHSAYVGHLLAAKDDKEMEAEAKRKNALRKRRLKAAADVNCLTSGATGGTRGSSSSTAAHGGDTYRVKLPPREFEKFDGDVRNWRSFWASFTEVDADAVTPDIEKYHFLLHAMVPGSRPHQVVKSYPPDGASYALARDELKDKFGRTKTIVKVYIRDLLKLVVENSKERRGDFTQMVTSLTAQIRCLEQLGLTQDNSGVILYPIVESCIPQEVLNRYLQTPGCKEEITDILDFLNQEVRRMDETALAQGSFEKDSGKKFGKSPSPPKGYNGKSTTPTAATFVNTEGKSTGKCGFCENRHNTADCRKAIKMTLVERRECLKKNGCCFRCLKYGHGSRKCYVPVVCMVCQKSHHTLMCWEASKSEKDGQGDQSTKVDQVPVSSKNEVKQSTDMSNYICKPEVLLQTLYIRLHGKKGTKVVRAMFDSGSQCTYIRKDLVDELSFPYVGQEKVVHQSFGAVLSKEVEHPVFKVEVSGLRDPHLEKYNFKASAIPQIAVGIIAPPFGSWFKECTKHGIQLSDINGEDSDIDLLIGNDISPYMKQGLRSTLLSSGLVATETRIGWILEGKIKGSESHQNNKAMMCINMNLSSLDVSNLWALETIGIRDSADTQSKAELEKTAMDYFRSTVTQDSTGRFQVHLPFLEGQRELPFNRQVAVARLHSTTQTLVRDKRLKDYHDIFQAWLAEGIIEKVPYQQRLPSSRIIHYLPHRAVYKENSTTPTRPVFNASSKVKGSRSLNDNVVVGPNLMELIPSIFMGFRLEKVGVTSDIRKAFLQIKVAEEDRDCMRFLWWNDIKTQKDIVEFRHCRVVFGVACSPFLLAATIKLLLEQNEHRYPDTVKVLQRSFYVDNCVTSFPSLEQAVKFEKEARELLALGQFDLRSWEIGRSANETKAPVLGMLWERKEDTLQYDLSHLKKKDDTEVTKRSVISFACIIFDPMGLICPFTILAKILFKKICMDKRKFGWDTPLPEEYSKVFMSWKQQAVHLEDVKVPRFLAGAGGPQSGWSIHTFCDASIDCYACCCYLRVEGTLTSVELIQARARVTPSKGITIPRAELLACLLGARLTNSIKEDLGLLDIPVTYWSDSSTAITWITRPDGKWARFVENRVKEIRLLTGTSPWRHVPGEKNPADLPSRGCSADKLLKLKWWEGPDWLYQTPSTFPHSKMEYDESSVNSERKKTVISAVAAVRQELPILDNLSRLGDYHRILRFVVFLMRFVRNKFILRKSADSHRVPEVTAEELQEAEIFILKHIQKSTWGSQPPHGVKCQLGADGVYRVVTQLINGGDDASFQRPALLPAKHPLVELIIYKHHSISSHAGVQYMQSILRNKYWIINSRRTIRNVIHRCPICRTFNAKRCHVEQAPLPANRINPSKCFEVTGVDLAGPLFLKNGDKVWIGIFTCAVYRAVHLELVTSLSTPAFLMALKKFVARRGRPRIIHSDNGTNFHGCANIFKRVDWTQVQKVTAAQEIKWIFNPPSAAWWGGFWERLIGLMKQLLRRNLGKRTVDLMELEVLIAETEAILNDRPLTYISKDEDDLRALTPSMFMKDLPVSSMPELDISSQELNRRLRYIQRVKEQLRQRFRSEYLGQLVSRGKAKPNHELSPGDVVLVEYENRKRWDWPMGVVIEVFRGRDGICRTAKVRTNHGVLTRPFQRLFPLEVKRKEEVPAHDAALPRKSVQKLEETGEENVPEEIQVPDLEEVEPMVITRSGRRVNKPDRFTF